MNFEGLTADREVVSVRFYYRRFFHASKFGQSDTANTFYASILDD